MSRFRFNFDFVFSVTVRQLLTHRIRSSVHKSKAGSPLIHLLMCFVKSSLPFFSSAQAIKSCLPPRLSAINQLAIVWKTLLSFRPQYSPTRPVLLSYFLDTAIYQAHEIQFPWTELEHVVFRTGLLQVCFFRRIASIKLTRNISGWKNQLIKINCSLKNAVSAL